MQISQTLECLAYQNIHNEMFYDGTQPRNICQHVDNCGKPRSLYPTWYHQNQMSELAIDMFCQKPGQNKRDQSQRREHITYLKSPRIAKAFNPKAPRGSGVSKVK